MDVNKPWHRPFRASSKNRYKRATLLAVIGTGALIACDGAVQLCGEYACVFYQSSCEIGHACNEPLRCEAAGSIRDRAPRIINELRSAQRTCSDSSQPENQARLVWDETLARTSESHTTDMAENRFESFTGSNGLSSTERVEQTEFMADIVFESIGSGPQTTAEIINLWLDIQTDCSQMLFSNTHSIGMACTLSDEPNPKPYWSLLLARSQTNAIRQ